MEGAPGTASPFRMPPLSVCPCKLGTEARRRLELRFFFFSTQENFNAIREGVGTDTERILGYWKELQKVSQRTTLCRTFLFVEAVLFVL